MRKIIIAWSLLVASNFMWALQFTCIKLTQAQVGPFFTVWSTMLVSTILLIPFAVKNYKENTHKKKISDVLIFIQLSLLGGLPAQVFITWGTQYSTASNAAIITLTLPVITAVLAFLILREKMNNARWISFSIAIIGVILCSTGDIQQLNFESKYFIGNLLCFMSMVTSAYYNVGCKRILERYSEMEVIFCTGVVTVTALTFFVLYYEPDTFVRIQSFTEQTWIGLGLLAFFQNFLSMILFFKALKTLDAMQAGLSNYLITFFGLPIAVLWLGETLRFQAILGGILIFISTLTVTIVDYRMNNKKNKLEQLIIKQP